MTNAQLAVGEQRPGGRAARVRADVLQAAANLLSEVGYERLTVDEVASRAGVHKTTVYRRWPSKADLISESLRAQSAQAVPIPNTGTLLSDLQEFAREIVANIGGADGTRRSRSIVAAAASSAELTTRLQELWAERLVLSSVIVERAIERGEVPAETDPNLIIETLIGPLWVRLLLTGEPIDDDLALRVAELVTAGAVARPAITPS
ncbi:MAG: TetR/AcrR family transcriptional regulator [Acidimicrobiales bacterium]